MSKDTIVTGIELAREWNVTAQTVTNWASRKPEDNPLPSFWRTPRVRGYYLNQARSWYKDEMAKAGK